MTWRSVIKDRLRRFTPPLVSSALVLALIGRTSSIVDSRDNWPPPGASLDLPKSYVAMSPVSRVLDALSLLSIPQTIWLFVGVALVVIGTIIATRGRSRRRLAVSLAIGIGLVIVAIAILEVSLILIPRPMANLGVTDPETLRIDFHSHTNVSKDANQRFTPDDNREWHKAGGFDVAYISDHVRFAGAADAIRKNPARAGDSLTVLSAVEGRYHKILSTVMLRLVQSDTSVLDGKGHLHEGTPSIGKTPVTIVAIPNGNIDSVSAESLDSLPHFAGMELVDAAPRGLGQLDREEDKIRRIASDRHLLLVSSSNNHGWGRTVAAWNLMTIPGWRAVTPDSLAVLIEKPFRERQTNAVTIVKRLRPRNYGLYLPLTLPVMLYQTIGSLTIAERGIWLLWIWAIALVQPLLKRTKVA
ncbi:MAG: hypothetical protein ABIZ36_13660 [Gemmatimonadaceae bacterium]